MPSDASRPGPARRLYFQSLRLTAGERAVVRARAHAAGLTVSEFLRRAALGKRVRARPGQVRRDAVYQLSKVGNNLNQLARAANTAGQVRAEELLEEALGELRAVLAELTGEGR
jgi:hypothetical protein